MTLPKLLLCSLALVFAPILCAETPVVVSGVPAREAALPGRVFANLVAGQHQTVVVYGTSLSIGGAWAKSLGAWFEAEFPSQVTFVNSARSGMHSGWGVENLRERVLAHNPDLVVLEFAVNDSATKHGISPEKCHENLDTMVKALRTQNPRVEIILQTMNPAWDSPAPVANGKKYATDRPHIADYYEVYRRYARQHDLPLVDNFPVWQKLRDEDPAAFQQAIPDGIHPGEEASNKVTWGALRTLLQQGRILAFKQASANAQPSAVVPLWPPGAMPGRGADAPEMDAPSKGDGVRRTTNVSVPTLTVFPGPKGERAPAAVIVCPGGGYSYVVQDKEGSEVAAWLNAAGFTALVLKYRVPQNRDGALQDLQRALRLARANAEAWNLDPKRLGALGFSAGGNLVAKASNHFGKPYPALDGVDSLSCRPDFAVLVYPAYLGKGGVLASDLDLTADIPPTLILHSKDDANYVPGSVLYDTALTAAGKQHTFINYPTGGHGYAMRCELEARAWPLACLEWLAQGDRR